MSALHLALGSTLSALDSDSCADFRSRLRSGTSLEELRSISLITPRASLVFEPLRRVSWLGALPQPEPAAHAVRPWQAERTSVRYIQKDGSGLFWRGRYSSGVIALVQKQRRFC